MTKYKAPSPVYLGPAAHHSGPGNKPIKRIVIHSTVGPTRKGSARNIAAYFRSPSAGGSAHYVVDAGEAVQVVYDSYIAWHAPPNAHSIGVEMCDDPSDKRGKKRWDDADHKAMLQRTARLVAELCVYYGVPPWFKEPWRLKRGGRGVTTHNNVSKAFGQSSHWDPGLWPRIKFMREVRRQVKLIKRGK